MTLKDQHIVIAGAGIIGLSAALGFADAGARVTVFESGRAMEQASWAAAGMLAVDDPENDLRLLPLSRLSRTLYPAFLRRVEELSGIAVPLRTSRTLQAAPHAADASTEALPELLSSPFPDLLSRNWQFQELEEASIDPRDLCAALPIAARAVGVTLREYTAVYRALAAESDSGVRVEVRHAAVEEPSEGEGLEVCTADHFLLAAGAWSGQVACGAANTPPVSPRKGQMLEVRLTEDAPRLSCVIRTPGLYLVPRGDGRVVIGATVESAGFDREIDPMAAEQLLRKAAALWPPILNSTVTAQWTGLRPGYSESDDTLPLIGPLDAPSQAKPCIWAATGHFRNGILLAPATARVLLAMLEGSTPPVSTADFAASRFVEARC